jgi:predicted metalloendopeptidase
MLLVSVTLGLASCSVEDNSVVTVDDKPFTYESEIDHSVRPGDNFYQYALGQWLNSSNPSPSYWKQIENENNQLTIDIMNNSSDPVVVFLRSQADETLSDDSKNKALLIGRLQMLEQITTADQLYGAFQTLYELGYGPLLRLTPFFDMGRKTTNVLCTGGMTDEMTDAVKNKNQAKIDSLVSAYCQHLSAFGFSDERINQIIQNAKTIETLEMKAYSSSYEMLRQPVKMRATRATEEEISRKIDEVMARMGITVEYMNDSKMIVRSWDIIALLQRFALADENPEDVNVFRDYMIYNVIAQDLPFVPSVNSKANRVDMMKSALHYNRYYKYRLFTEAYGYDNIYKQQCTDIMERMRKIFIQRLEKIDWMTEATKAETRSKAEAMKFFIGYPEQWNEEFTPTVNGDCMLASATQLRQNVVSLIKNLPEKSFDDAAWDVWAIMGQFTVDNAFYMSLANSLVILPSWITKPRFDNDLSEAVLYAFSTTFGHEFCHGFDSLGSQTDADGNIIDWWAPEDMAAFQEKQQILISIYDQMEAYPGQNADGTKTLNENMADYGGIELSLTCYKQRLTELGFKGKQYDEQIRKFFLSYAQLWKNERELSIEILKTRYETDVHSAPHNRVNGMMRLQDDWYRLYDVKPTDKLYLAPADRVKIW